METTESNEATFPSSGHQDSPPSLLSLSVHTQASSPSPPCTQQHASFPPLSCAPFLQPSHRVSSPSSRPLPPTVTVLYLFLVFRLDLSVDPMLKITERWRGLQQIQLLQNKKIMQDLIWHKIIITQHQFLTILLMRRWRSVCSNAKLEHIQYLCLYVSSSSDLATLQGSPQKHMDTGIPLGRGNGSKAFPVIRP